MDQRPFLFDLESLRTFVAIAEAGSFSKAAETVARAPSAVSMLVKKLERQLGASLFVRTSRTVMLTSDGEKLLSPARNLLALSNETAARFVSDERQGVVRLGAPNDIAERFLPSILKRINANHPAIAVDVVVWRSETLLAGIQQGNLDLAVINYAGDRLRPPGQLLRKDRIVWAAAKNGVAYRAERLPLALYEEGCIWRAAALENLEAIDRPYRIAFLSSHSMMHAAAVDADLAISPLPSAYVTDKMRLLGDADGLPDLPLFDVRLVMADQELPVTKLVADEVRAALAA